MVQPAAPQSNQPPSSGTQSDVCDHDTDSGNGNPPAKGAVIAIPPPVARVQRRAGRIDPAALAAQGIASRCLADALGVHRCSYEAFAIAAGVTSSEVDRLADPDCERTINLARLLMAARTRGGVVRTLMAAVLGHMDHEVTAGPRLPIPTRLMHVMAEIGHLTDKAREALTDGVVSDEERRDMLRECKHAREQIEALERELGA